jgi:nitroreductase
MESVATGTGRHCGVDLLDAIYARRAVRAYTDRRVEPELVHRLIDAAIHAPSAVNAQPWAFVVVEDGGLLKRISDRAKRLTLARARPGSLLWDQRSMLEDPAFNVFYDASTLIVLCAAPTGEQANEDCCLAAQTLMLAAHGLGLATCPIGFAREALNEPEFRRELSIPADHSAVFPLIVGYPRERPPATERRAPRILAWKRQPESPPVASATGSAPSA